MVTFNLTLRDLERSYSRSQIFQCPICRYWMDLGLRLLLNTNRNSYMTFKMVTFNSTLCDLERSNSRSRIYQHPISHYWMELGLRFLLNTNMKSYMTFKMVNFNLTLCDLERSNSRSRIYCDGKVRHWSIRIENRLAFIVLGVHDGTRVMRSERRCMFCILVCWWWLFNKTPSVLCDPLSQVFAVF